jgi:hypothetical protein
MHWQSTLVQRFLFLSPTTSRGLDGDYDDDDGYLALPPLLQLMADYCPMDVMADHQVMFAMDGVSGRPRFTLTWHRPREWHTIAATGSTMRPF